MLQKYALDLLFSSPYSDLVRKKACSIIAAHHYFSNNSIIGKKNTSLKERSTKIETLKFELLARRLRNEYNEARTLQVFVRNFESLLPEMLPDELLLATTTLESKDIKALYIIQSNITAEILKRRLKKELTKEEKEKRKVIKKKEERSKENKNKMGEK